MLNGTEVKEYGVRTHTTNDELPLPNKLGIYAFQRRPVEHTILTIKTKDGKTITLQDSEADAAIAIIKKS